MKKSRVICENCLIELGKNTKIHTELFDAVGLQVVNFTWKLIDEDGRFNCFIELAGNPADKCSREIVIRINIYDENGSQTDSSAIGISPEGFAGFNTKHIDFTQEGALFKACKAKVFVSSLIAADIMLADEAVVPVEKELASLKPNKAGLYPHEILAIEYAPQMWLDEDQYKSFWWFQYGVKDVKNLLDSLMSRGFIKEGSLYESLQAYNFNDLRRNAKEVGVKAGGSRADIIKRLFENVPIDQLETVFPRRSYAVTEKGKDAIKDDDYVMFIHRHPKFGFSVYSMNRLLDGNPKNYLDCLFDHFRGQMLEDLKKNNYGLYRNNLMIMADVFFELEQYKKAFILYEEVAFWDLSGLGNGEFNLEILAPYWFPYEKSPLKIAPLVVQRIKECKEKLEMTNGEFNTYSQNTIDKLSAPFHVFLKQEVIRILVCEMNYDLQELNSIFETAKTRLQVKYPQISF